MQTECSDRSFAVFPYLKTSDAVSIGELIFRSTDVADTLTPKQGEYLNDIADMLFLKDNLRIKSGCYALIPFIDMNQPAPDVGRLKEIQAVIAYCYASPRHEFGDIFLSPEHASMVIFSPSLVPKSLVWPDFHVCAVEGSSSAGDNRGRIDGYAGLYNFRHHFWVARGSRLYGPVPHIGLNMSQDLRFDITQAENSRCDYRLLCSLLKKNVTQTSARVFNSLHWFNAANSEGNGPEGAIVDLSIAFEALMRLPADQKTDRLTDAISLLLGRVPRLDIWARQFYQARSEVVHEGSMGEVNFIATDSIKKTAEGHKYQSLLSYGRQIFQLCLGTLLTGAELAESSGLEEKFITNEERFREICTILSNNEMDTGKRLESILPIVTVIDQYKYIGESGLRLETMIGATRLAAKVLLENSDDLPNELKEDLSRLVSAERTNDHFEELDALRKLESAFKEKTLQTKNICRESVQKLVESVWGDVFMHYFWLKERLTEG
ncbi:MAG TPA: hypothetical protein VMX13_09700 [Sedimentisphaerales bacterium]|nr:hypothetical protein [Sedimentisphaerales bacterium]